MARIARHEGVALSSSFGSLTYAELASWSDHLAAQIFALGSAQERSFGILAPAGLEFAAALLGIWKAGGIAVPLQPQHPKAELEYLLADARPAQVFVAESCLPLAQELGVSAILISRGANITNCPSPDSNDGALMIYTSGTTNRPKGVVTTQGGLAAQVSTLLEAWRWSAADRTLNVLPLHHVHGLVNVLTCSLAAGATCELAEKFRPELVWEKLPELTLFMAVPTIYAKLLAHWREQAPETRARWSADAGRLRLMVSGSAALPAPLAQNWEHATGQRLLERYGMTEIGMALSNPLVGERRLGTVGKPLPGVEMRLEKGEIQVRGPTVFREYCGLAEATRESFTADGWFRTGDIAELDEAGYYRILGRSSQDILKSGGFKISALEIESRLLENEDVSEVAVVGIEDPLWGEKIAAAYVGNASGEALAAWLKERIASYKVPAVWRKVEELPRNAMGKVQKPLVRVLFAERE